MTQCPPTASAEASGEEGEETLGGGYMIVVPMSRGRTEKPEIKKNDEIIFCWNHLM